MPANDLSDAIREIAGPIADEPTIASLGPGIVYLLELPNGRPHYFAKTEGSFPPAFYKLLEATERWQDIVLEADRATYSAAISTDAFEPQARYRIQVNRRGETLPVVDYRTLVRNAAGRPVAVAGRLVDDSFRTVAFEALARRSWKEIAGSMTRRYLHDFNNTIAGIYSLSELYAEPGSDAKSSAEAMGHIRDCSIRAQDLTKKIRLLTTLEAGQKTYFDLGSLLKDQPEYMEALLPKGASISLDIAPGEHPLKIDANAFRQVILHLTSNACDACGEDAEVKMSLRKTEEHDREMGIIEFCDNGSGFKEGELEQATTAFYSTKNSDKHPGLGLSIVQRFANELGGRIELDNGENGAIVRIALPLLGPESLSDSLAKEPSSKTRTPFSGSAVPNKTKAEVPTEPPKVLIYSWEDISRHPLLLAMQKEGWSLRTYLEPGELLLDLLQDGAQLDGVVVFKSALDEKAEPLLSELGHARNCEKVALVGLGESVDALSASAKRICGIALSGSSKPSALLKQLNTFFG